MEKKWSTMVIGAGQAGLAIGYYLKELKEDFIIVDERSHVGDEWRNCWDSLALFIPQRMMVCQVSHFQQPKGFSQPRKKWQII